MRAALDADGRLLAPADWTVARGRTLALVRARGKGDVTEALLLPGFVNAHAHLDLAGSAALPASGSFPDWLLAVGGARKSAVDESADAARQADDLARNGVVAVGDIDAHLGRATRGRRAAGLGGRSYLEIVGVAAASCRRRLLDALDVVDRLGRGRDELGLSPHAPYSVNEAVLPEIVRAARARHLPLAMHLAESLEETRYMLHGDGPFVAFLEAIGRGRPFTRAPGLRPIAYAEASGLLAAGAVVIHGNDLDDDDVELLLRHGNPVVYCHGTHRHFGRPPHRLSELAAAGVEVALGTDSSASNEGVDLFGEACRLVADRPDVDPALVLRAATHGGRVALGLAKGPARFMTGSSADGLLLAAPPNDVDADTLLRWAFSGESRPSITLAAGRARPGPGARPEGALPFLDSEGAHG
ncbi:MAG: amidohydrolase family protein [Planctomycetes bacterium]|nr:amidohydrolase family protein [Planctomycetota bacterium]